MEDKPQSKDNAHGTQFSQSKIKTVNLALTGVLAGVYGVATFALGIVSFGILNLRLTNILLGVVPIFGWPGVFGIALGVLLGNFASPLGPIDLLSAFFSLIGLSAIHLLRKRSVPAGLAIYDLILSLWVSFELSFVYRLPYLPTLYVVIAGMTLVLALAYFFYLALLRTGLRKRVESVLK
ncbi:MAG: QueT transporter family protein [Nitrososphaerales archaeon]